MKTLKVPLKEAETTKKLLGKKGFIDFDYQIYKTSTHIFFPLNKKFKKTKKLGFSISNKVLSKKNQLITLKDLLKRKLTKNQFEKLKTSYDIVGDIAILEIDKWLEKRAKIIADSLLKSNKMIKTVLKKEGAHEGVLRTQKMKFLAGKKTKETIYKENNIKLKLNVEKVYFSPRLSNERKRIYKIVKPRESVLVMFSGCAPYPCVISKNSCAKEIYGIEINPAGHKYGLENVKLNKLDNVTLFLGDVKAVVPKLKKKFDRILMPLPKTAEDFLDTALSVTKKGSIVHFYNFCREDEFNKFKQIIKKACVRNKKKCRILRVVKCGQHKPYTYRICIDFKII